jgi:uncharacterized protein (DUF1330 family)
MKTISPTKAQLDAMTADKAETPFVMVNLLKFKTATAAGEPGRKAYQRYARNTAAHLARAGGRVVWAGEAQQVFIGTPDKGWDWVLLVEYPSRQAFLTMIADPAYKAIHEDREAGLEDSVLMACNAIPLAARGAAG